MEPKNEQAINLLEASSQDFSISIRGKMGADGTWQCSVISNEVVLSDEPPVDFSVTMDMDRRFDQTEFMYSFADAFRHFDQSEWFLCRPLKIHKEFAAFVLEAFEERMGEYAEQNPGESPTVEFIRKSRIDEWRAKVAASLSSNP